MDFKDKNNRLSSAQWRERLRTSNEEAADALVLQGDFDGAFESLKRAKRHDTDGRENQLDMKIVSLPFLELDYRLKRDINLDVGLIDEAEAVYGMAGDLLAEQVYSLSLQQQSSSTYAKTLGNISELTVLSLGARHFNHTAESFIVPSARSHDYAKRYASDLRLVEVETKRDHNLQIKTSRRHDHAERYSNFITLLAMSDVDFNFFRRPDNKRSVAHSIIAELSGDYTEETTRKLNRATNFMFDVIHHKRAS